nr:immunoglobulin light chain junction region [Macaca mulatta]MOX77862.1 immunoglobulin light chain junction region [Macaca mulatta]MOX78256.1 immunoglobulin light chain junction region [Macaca mulatta]MOX78562.1 immunoglobulin light chain junction region [Macaca mulatta]MOX79468.1 immunoglobulin light chain junction region [Macaca mulatta]
DYYCAFGHSSGNYMF